MHHQEILKMSCKSILNFQISKTLIDMLLMQVVPMSSGSSPCAPTNVEGRMK